MNVESTQFKSRILEGRIAAGSPAACHGREGGGVPVSHAASPKRRAFAWTFLAALLATYLVVIALNWLGNGSGCFVSPLCPSLTDRAWKTRRIEEIVHTDGAPQVLILGSSRLMQMRPSQVQAITGKRCFNYCVVSANILDYVTLFRHALAIGAKPEILVVDIRRFDCDVSSFNSQLASHAGLFEAVSFPEKLQIVGKVLQAVNLTYTAKSVRNLARALLHGRFVHDGTALEDGEIIIVNDGYRLNRVNTVLKANGKFDLPAVLAGSTAERRAGGSIQGENVPCNPWWLAHFRQLLTLARTSGVHVVVVTTPIHSQYEALLSKEEKRYLHEDMPSILKRECGHFGMEFRDFSRLESFAGDPDEFWDIVHQTPVNMQRMTNVLFGVDSHRTVAHLPSDIEVLQSLPEDGRTDGRGRESTEGKSP